MLEYAELEKRLTAEAAAVEAAGESWNAAEVAARLRDLAEQLAAIRRQHSGGIDASMGKRSGIHLEP
ncbi:MAG: hypothetical protein C4534_01815 [Gaiellales bacterium]|nr:MAG: hypothetical protein C4534_01815 [Gaiellales bacterium]